MLRILRTSLFSAACLTFGLSAVHAQAVQGPLAPEAAPTFELDKKGKRDLIDYSIALKPISSPTLKLSQFQGRKLMVFFFSAQCPHCQNAVPYVQKLADEIAPKGFSAIAVAIANNSEEDVRGFIRDFGVRMPMLQDDERAFGERYGTGRIPVVYLVNEKGEYIRYKSFEHDLTPAQIRTVANAWVPDKKKK